MNKNHLLSILEAEKNKYSKKPKQFNKSLIESILEEQRLPNLMDVDTVERKGEIVTLPKNTEDEAIKSIEAQKDKKNVEEEKKEKNKDVIKFATDLGIKAIIYDNTFINIDEQGKYAISDIFNEKEIDAIHNNENWQRIKREPIYALKAHVDKNANRVRCFNSKLNKFSENPGKYILTMYRRSDDKTTPEMIPDPKFKDKKTGEKKVLPYILMEPAHNEEIYILPVSARKYAVVLQLPYQPDPYLFKMSPDVVDFFHSKQ